MMLYGSTFSKIDARFRSKGCCELNEILVLFSFASEESYKPVNNLQRVVLPAPDFPLKSSWLLSLIERLIFFRIIYPFSE